MKKKHRIITVDINGDNYNQLLSRVCQLLDEGWKLERVDSPNVSMGGVGIVGILVYLLSKEE